MSLDRGVRSRLRSRDDPARLVMAAGAAARGGLSSEPTLLAVSRDEADFSSTAPRQQAARWQS